MLLFTLPLYPLDNMSDTNINVLLRKIEEKLATELPPLT